MTDQRQGGFGAILKIIVSATLTAVTFVEEHEFPEFEKILADITSHDSPGGYTEWIDTGKRKVNSFKVKLTWDIGQTTHAAMIAAFDSQTYVAMSVQDADGREVIAFNAFIQKVGRIAEQEKGYVCDVTIQPTGDPLINGS